MTASPKETIARRIAKEVRPDSLVNLGIGLPTIVGAYMPPGVTAFFLTENGMIGIGAPPPPGMENPDLVDAGGPIRLGPARGGEPRQHHRIRSDPRRAPRPDRPRRPSG